MLFLVLVASCNLIVLIYSNCLFDYIKIFCVLIFLFCKLSRFYYKVYEWRDYLWC
jgi:hypothetical protein